MAVQGWAAVAGGQGWVAAADLGWAVGGAVGRGSVAGWEGMAGSWGLAGLEMGAVDWGGAVAEAGGGK